MFIFQVLPALSVEPALMLTGGRYTGPHLWMHTIFFLALLRLLHRMVQAVVGLVSPSAALVLYEIYGVGGQ